MERTGIIALFVSISMHAAVLGGVAGLHDSKPVMPTISYESKQIDNKDQQKLAVLPEIKMLGPIKQLKNNPEPASENPPADRPLKEEDPVISAEKQEILKLKTEDDYKAEKAMLRYQDMIKQKIEKNRRYPLYAKNRKTQGIANLKFTIDRAGFCKMINMVKSSNSDLLDQEALSTIKRAEPFPAIPAEISSDLITMSVAIVFSLK